MLHTLARWIEDLAVWWDRLPARRRLAAWWLERTWRYRRFTVRYSADEKLYYVEELHGRAWLTVAKHTGPHPGTDKSADGFMAGGLDIEKKDGEKYWRLHYPFAFYNVRAGERRRVRGTDDLVADYLSLQGAG